MKLLAVHDLARRWAGPMTVGIVIGAATMQGLQAQAPAVQRKPLVRTDLTGVDGKEVYVTLLEAQPGGEFPAHVHHGDEILFVIDGSLDGFLEQERNILKGGDAFHAPRQKVHGGTAIGNTPTRMLAVHIVDKGKPLTEFVKK